MNTSYLQIGDELLSNALLDSVTVTQELNRHWRLDVRFRQTMDKRPPYEFAPRVACYTTSSLPTLATEIAGLTGLTASVQAGGQTAAKQYVQWGETDFRFLHRICGDHKAWLRPAANGVEIFDRFQAGVPLAFRE